MWEKHGFETRPGPVGRPGTRPTRGWNRAGLKKKWGKKKPGVTRLQTHWLLFIFVFFLLKRHGFDFFKKKLTWPTLWLDQNSESRSGTGPGLKTMERSVVCMKKKTKENICKKRKSLWHRSRIMAQPVFCWLWPTFMAWNNKVTLAGFSMAYDNHPCLLHNLEWHDFRFVYLLSHLYF